MVLRRESVRSRHLVIARSSGLRQQKRGSCGLKLGAKVNYSRAASYFQSIRAWAAPSIPFSTVKSMTNWLRYPIPKRKHPSCRRAEVDPLSSRGSVAANADCNCAKSEGSRMRMGGSVEKPKQWGQGPRDRLEIQTSRPVRDRARPMELGSLAA
jgi:hypothetical protein